MRKFKLHRGNLKQLSSNKNFLAGAFLFLLPPLFFWRETLGWFTLGSGDTVCWFFAEFAYAVERIYSGYLPLWNPNVFCGTPLFAEPQVGLLDPLNWIYFASTTARAMTISQELTFVVSLLASFAYAR